jgi:ubiquinone biosynthesis protein
VRILWVIIVIAWCTCEFLVRAAYEILFGRQKNMAGIVGESLALGFERLGGAFLKAGQILSTRVDLLPPEVIAALARLRDNVRPLKFGQLQVLLLPLQEPADGEPKMDIMSSPLASATISQIHVATIHATGDKVAIKIRRPGINKLLSADVYYIRLFTRFFSRFPWIRRFPISEAVDEICTALLQQVDFAAEARMTMRFYNLFSDNPSVTVPAIDASRCTNDLIVMEYLSGYRPIQRLRDQPELAKTAVRTGLRALYTMIFNAGLIHCDLHTSNILCNDSGRLALLDFGFVSEMSLKAKRDFAKFFLSIAFRDGKTAARVVRETALHISDDLDMLAFERDMQVLVDTTAGRKAADFQVAGFVFELFQIQRRHNIYGSPTFTLPILSLLTYEGLIKDIYPEIDFQQEAVPFIMAALAKENDLNAEFATTQAAS